MARAVIDSSVIVSWFLPDETDGMHDAILNNIDKIRIHVPSIFEYEILNILLNAHKRERIDRSTAVDILEIISQYPIVMENSTAILKDNINLFEMAQEHDLTAYDTAYLELAVRLNVPLITYDRSLLKAAKKLRIRTAI